MARAVVDEGCNALDARSGGVWMLDPPERLRLLYGTSSSAVQLARLDSVPLSARRPLTDAVRVAQPIWLPGPRDWQERYPELHAGPAVACVPLVCNDRVGGGLVYEWDHERAFDDGDCDFLITVSEQCAHALERLRTHDAEHGETETADSRQALRLSEARFRSIYEQAAVGIEQVTADDCILDANDALCRMLGYERQDFIGRNIRDLSHPADYRVELGLQAQLWRGEVPSYTLEKRYIHRCGHLVWGRVTSSLTRVPNENIQYRVSIIENITERKRTEHALREADRKLLELERTARREAEAARRRLTVLDQVTRRLMEDVHEPNTIQRLAHSVVPGLADWCVVHVPGPDGSVSIAAVAAAGSERAREVPAEWQRQALDPDLRWGAPGVLRTGETEFVSDIDDALRGAGGRHVEHLASLRAANMKSLIAVALRAEGKVIGCISLLHTAASDRRFTVDDVAVAEELAVRAALILEQERLFRQAEAARARAEEASRTKDEFLAMLGHELRNPLAPIMTALGLMRLRSNQEPSREQVVIERQVNHLLRLVDDLLDISRVTRGKVELKRATIEIAPIVAKAVEMTSSLIEQHRHQLVLEVPLAGLCVEGDEARLVQVLSNLLTNAARYTPPGGRITVTACRERGFVCIRVRDTGIGLASELIPRIFELFFQGGERRLDRSEGGLGLGLALVRSLVEMHGGTVDASSDGPRKGSEFTVRLPAMSPFEHDTVSVPRRAVLPVPEASMRVLVVDDNEDAGTLLADLLRAVGHEVAVATDGASALVAAAEFLPQVAVLDIGLPVMDGYELAHRLRELDRLANIRLIAVTGYGQEHDRNRAHAAGFDRHFVKPVDPAQLMSALDGRA